MSDTERKEEKRQELQDKEPEIREFVRKTDEHMSQAKRALERKRRRRAIGDYVVWIVLICVLLNYAIIITCSILFVEIPALVVVLVVVFETLLAVCLCQSPIWLHGLVILINLVLGMIFSMLVFMLLASEIYLVGTAVMHQKKSR